MIDDLENSLIQVEVAEQHKMYIFYKLKAKKNKMQSIKNLMFHLYKIWELQILW